MFPSPRAKFFFFFFLDSLDFFLNFILTFQVLTTVRKIVKFCKKELNLFILFVFKTNLKRTEFKTREQKK